MSELNRIYKIFIFKKLEFNIKIRLCCQLLLFLFYNFLNQEYIEDESCIAFNNIYLLLCCSFWFLNNVSEEE